MINNALKRSIAFLLVLICCVWVSPTLAKENSIEALKKAAEVDPNDYAPHFGLGQAYNNMGLYNRAIVEYLKTIELEPLFAAAHSGLGSSYGALARYEEAVDSFKEAIRLGPNYSDAQYGLGWTYTQLEEHEKAWQAPQI